MPAVRRSRTAGAVDSPPRAALARQPPAVQRRSRTSEEAPRPVAGTGGTRKIRPVLHTLPASAGPARAGSSGRSAQQPPPLGTRGGSGSGGRAFGRAATYSYPAPAGQPAASQSLRAPPRQQAPAPAPPVPSPTRPVSAAAHARRHSPPTPGSARRAPAPAARTAGAAAGDFTRLTPAACGALAQQRGRPHAAAHRVPQRRAHSPSGTDPTARNSPSSPGSSPSLPRHPSVSPDHVPETPPVQCGSSLTATASAAAAAADSVRRRSSVISSSSPFAQRIAEAADKLAAVAAVAAQQQQAEGPECGTPQSLPNPQLPAAAGLVPGSGVATPRSARARVAMPSPANSLRFGTAKSSGNLTVALEAVSALQALEQEMTLLDDIAQLERARADEEAQQGNKARDELLEAQQGLREALTACDQQLARALAAEEDAEARREELKELAGRQRELERLQREAERQREALAEREERLEQQEAELSDERARIEGLVSSRALQREGSILHRRTLLEELAEARAERARSKAEAVANRWRWAAARATSPNRLPGDTQEAQQRLQEGKQELVALRARLAASEEARREAEGEAERLQRTVDEQAEQIKELRQASEDLAAARDTLAAALAERREAGLEKTAVETARRQFEEEWGSGGEVGEVVDEFLASARREAALAERAERLQRRVDVLEGQLEQQLVAAQSSAAAAAAAVGRWRMAHSSPPPAETRSQPSPALRHSSPPLVAVQPQQLRPTAAVAMPLRRSAKDTRGGSSGLSLDLEDIARRRSSLDGPLSATWGSTERVCRQWAQVRAPSPAQLPPALTPGLRLLLQAQQQCAAPAPLSPALAPGAPPAALPAPGTAAGGAQGRGAGHALRCFYFAQAAAASSRREVRSVHSKLVVAEAKCREAEEQARLLSCRHNQPMEPRQSSWRSRVGATMTTLGDGEGDGGSEAGSAGTAGQGAPDRAAAEAAAERNRLRRRLHDTEAELAAAQQHARAAHFDAEGARQRAAQLAARLKEAEEAADSSGRRARAGDSRLDPAAERILRESLAAAERVQEELREQRDDWRRRCARSAQGGDQQGLLPLLEQLREAARVLRAAPSAPGAAARAEAELSSCRAALQASERRAARLRVSSARREAELACARMRLRGLGGGEHQAAEGHLLLYQAARREASAAAAEALRLERELAALRRAPPPLQHQCARPALLCADDRERARVLRRACDALLGTVAAVSAPGTEHLRDCAAQLASALAQPPALGPATGGAAAAPDSPAAAGQAAGALGDEGPGAPQQAAAPHAAPPLACSAVPSSASETGSRASSPLPAPLSAPSSPAEPPAVERPTPPAADSPATGGCCTA